MFADLLREARDRADRSSPPIRSAALVHIARVLTKLDPADAARVLDEGLALAATLPPDERGILLGEGVVLAATVSPARAIALLPAVERDRASVVTQMIARMVDHGWTAEAVEYLTDSASTTDFPFAMVLHTIGRSSDDELKRRVLRRAIAAMRDGRGKRREPAPFGRHDFTQLFTAYWRILPADEARTVLHEIVERILSQPDQRVNASFGAGAYDVQFASAHEQQLFEILEPLHHLDPELVASVVPRYAQLSAAALRFPYGQASMTAMMMADAPPPPTEWPAAALADMDAIDVGRRFVPIREAIRTEFREAFDAALDEYEDDADPGNLNEVPQQCWPSAAAFRNILYKAGLYEGLAAARYLERIPDPALRLFAQIELAAALAGLPQLGSRTMRRGAKARREMAGAGAEGAPARPPVDGLFEFPPPRKPDLPPSRQLRVTPAAAPAGAALAGGSGPDFVEIRNATLKAVVSHLYETPPPRIEWPASIDPDARYDFVLVLPREERHDERMRLLRDGIATHFGVRISSEARPKEVWVMTAPQGIRCRERRTAQGSGGFGAIALSHHTREVPQQVPDGLRLFQILGQATELDGGDPEVMLARMRREITRGLAAATAPGTPLGGIEGALTIPELCAVIEPGLDRPVVDETGLTGTYMIDLDAGEAAPGDVLAWIASRLGLVATRAQRTVPTLVIYEDLR